MDAQNIFENKIHSLGTVNIQTTTLSCVLSNRNEPSDVIVHKKKIRGIYENWSNSIKDGNIWLKNTIFDSNQSEISIK